MLCGIEKWFGFRERVWVAPIVEKMVETRLGSFGH